MPQVWGLANETLPTRVGAGDPAQVRTDRYGAVHIAPDAEATEGMRFQAGTPTPGTGVAQPVITAFSATNALLSIFNGNAAGGRSLYLHYIDLIVTTVGASATSCQSLFVVDTSNRYSSGGSLLTARNANSGSSEASGAVVRFGDVTVTAETGGVRRLMRHVFKTGILVLDADMRFECSKGSAYPHTQIVVAPQHSLVLHVWNPANAATPPAFECDIGWWER